MTQYTKPIPIPQPESDRYWEGNRRGELWLRRCVDCDRAYFYPRDICPHCFSRNTNWFRSSGEGTLYAFSIPHRAPQPGFIKDLPYIVALVELEDGIRFPTNIIGVEPDPGNLKVGMRLKVVFEKLSDDITLPKFTPIDTKSDPAQ